MSLGFFKPRNGAEGGANFPKLLLEVDIRQLGRVWEQTLSCGRLRKLLKWGSLCSAGWAVLRTRQVGMGGGWLRHATSPRTARRRHHYPANEPNRPQGPSWLSEQQASTGRGTWPPGGQGTHICVWVISHHWGRRPF